MFDEEILLEDLSIPTYTFNEYRELNEVFHNFLPKDIEKKKAHSKEVFDLVQKSYSDQGGIKGSGFSSPDDMVKNIPMWKVAKKDGKITSVALYKDTHGKKHAGEMMSSDLRHNRSHMEISGKSLSFLKKTTDITPHLHTFDSAKKFHKSRGDEIFRPSDDDKEVVRHPELKDHMYSRMLGGQLHTKVMMGYLGNHITEMSKDEEKEYGKDSTLNQGSHQYGNWSFDSGLHGPARAKERQPNWKHEDWHDLLHRGHEALTNPSKQIVDKGKSHFKLKAPSAVLVYSKSKQQGVILRVSPKDNNNPKLGGTSRIETIPPHKASFAKDGTHRIVIENIEILEENIIIIE
jgi:hypothetical protein